MEPSLNHLTYVFDAHFNILPSINYVLIFKSNCLKGSVFPLFQLLQIKCFRKEEFSDLHFLCRQFVVLSYSQFLLNQKIIHSCPTFQVSFHKTLGTTVRLVRCLLITSQLNILHSFDTSSHLTSIILCTLKAYQRRYLLAICCNAWGHSNIVITSRW